MISITVNIHSLSDTRYQNLLLSEAVLAYLCGTILLLPMNKSGPGKVEERKANGKIQEK
jgi:hypothetical protein